MEPQNQEIVTSGSPAEVPNDPGYEKPGYPDPKTDLHYIHHQRDRACVKTERKNDQ